MKQKRSTSQWKRRNVTETNGKTRSHNQSIGNPKQNVLAIIIAMGNASSKRNASKCRIYVTSETQKLFKFAKQRLSLEWNRNEALARERGETCQKSMPKLATIINIPAIPNKTCWRLRMHSSFIFLSTTSTPFPMNSYLMRRTLSLNLQILVFEKQHTW